MTDQLRVSATLYTTWKRCPAQARARLDGHYPEDSVAQFKGLLAHRIFARHLTKGHIAPSGFRKTCQEEIGSSQLNWKMRDLGLRPNQVRSVISEVEDLYRRFTTLKPAGQAEVHLEHQLTDDVVLIGTIDCVTGAETAPRLIDWKTGELGEAEDQLRFYAAVWMLVFGNAPTAVEAVSVQTGERFEEWVDPKALNRVLIEVAEMVADLTRPPVVETPGPWCRWCPILEDCDPGQKAMRLVG